MCGGISPPTHTCKKFWDTSWMCYNSSQFWHLPGDSVGSHRLRTQFPPASPVASPSYHLCFWLTGYRSDVPTTPIPILGLVSFLEQFMELRENFYSPEVTYLKGGNSGTARWKGCTGQGVWAGAPMPAPSTPCSLHLHVFLSWKL